MVHIIIYIIWEVYKNLNKNKFYKNCLLFPGIKYFYQVFRILQSDLINSSRGWRFAERAFVFLYCKLEIFQIE